MSSLHVRQCLDRMDVVFRARIRHRRVLFPVHGHAAIISVEPVNDHIPLSLTTIPTATLRRMAPTSLSPPQQQGPRPMWTAEGEQWSRSLFPSTPHSALSEASSAEREECDTEITGMGMMSLAPCVCWLDGPLVQGSGINLHTEHCRNASSTLPGAPRRGVAGELSFAGLSTDHPHLKPSSLGVLEEESMGMVNTSDIIDLLQGL